MIKFTLLFSFIILGHSSLLRAAEKPFIISGFDDVLRQAENTGLFKAALKILEKDKTFSGMPELYQAISREEESPHFVLVSGISYWFENRITKFLKKSHFPDNKLHLRNWLTQWSVENFKVDHIKNIIADRPNRKFIVIFDNSDASLGLAEKLHAEFLNTIHVVYLHQVIDKKIPSSAVSYYTAFDIALNEYAANRMNTDEVVEVGQAIVKETKVDMLFPSYAVCPEKYNPCKEVSGDILDICSKVKDHIAALCSQHQ
jgi:phosphatidate phosphatase APP1